MRVFRLYLNFLFLLIITPHFAGAEPASRVYLNGRPTPVYFNDGDSFRVLGGPLMGTKARLAGFNTLESYGKVHRWGGWTKKELYWNAKMATLNARRGVWHCSSKDLKKDTYGRILWYCLDLAVDQVRRGYAHVMSVNHNPGLSILIAAQNDAIKHRRGMWAHGRPEYVLTSLHSAAEGGGKDGKTYNRMVSTRDGHSAKWAHTKEYEKCSEICSGERRVSEDVVDKMTQLLLKEKELEPILKKLTKHHPRQMVSDYLRLGYFVGIKSKTDEEMIMSFFRKLEANSTIVHPSYVEGSCVVYVDFRERFGKRRAPCLD